MKIAIVYFSLEGNTKYAAEYIGAITGADIYELRPRKAYPTGKVSKYISGKDALAGAMPDLEPIDLKAEEYDKIAIGTPVWAGNPAPPINTFLSTTDLRNKEVAFFCCSLTGKGDKALRKMMEMAGVRDALTLSLKDPYKESMKLAHEGDRCMQAEDRNRQSTGVYQSDGQASSIGEVGSEETQQSIMERWCLELLGNYETDELWDLYDKDRNLLEQKMNRGAEIPEGCYHLVVSCWIRNSEGKYLMSKRSMKKGWCPGAWETTGGAVSAGESSLEGAVREVREELGITLDPGQGRLVRSVRSDGIQDFYDVWMFDKDIDLDDIVMQKEEVDDVRWMSVDEIDRLWDEGKLHILLKYYKEIL